MDNTTYIYALIDPETRGVRYIGRTNNLDRRFQQHHTDRTNIPRLRWIESLKSKGLSMTYIVLEECAGEAAAKKAEVMWIKLFLEKGASLFNQIYPGYDRKELLTRARNFYTQLPRTP